MYEESEFRDYIKETSRTNKVNWWDLPDNIKLEIYRFPKEIKKLGNFVCVRRIRKIKLKKEFSENIINIKKSMMGNKKFRIKFPLFINNKEYARLYALMVSEGSYRTEFNLHVPEFFFHKIFKDCIQNLISEDCAKLIKRKHNKGFLRSRAPAILRHIIPIPQKIPFMILKDKELAREYLKIVFEAEGSAIYSKKGFKRYVKLSRYIDIAPFVKKEKIPLEKRVYLKDIKKLYPNLFKRIRNQPPDLLLGEKILLKNHFGIGSSLSLEAIRKNKTDLRCGKITARWVLFIYANNVNKYIKEIGFISKKKKLKLKEMKKIKGNNPQYSSLEIIKRISNKKGYFRSKDFVIEMKKIDYKSPNCYLARYHKKGLIKRVKKGFYKTLFSN